MTPTRATRIQLEVLRLCERRRCIALPSPECSARAIINTHSLSITQLNQPHVRDSKAPHDETAAHESAMKLKGAVHF